MNERPARLVWDFAFGVILIAGIPMIFLGVVGGAILLFEQTSGRISGWIALPFLAIIGAINFGLIIGAIRFRYRHRLLPQSYILGEIFCAMVCGGLLAFCWMTFMLRAGMAALHD